MKDIKITDSKQKVAVDILTRLYFIKDFDEFFKVMAEIEDIYDLCFDPFTSMPCTTKDYFKLKIEYEKQCMEGKFGYYE